MIHKITLLTSLLIPATFITYGQNIDAQIRELKNSRFEKQLELSDLGKRIAEKDELLHSIALGARNFFTELIKKKELNEQEAKEFGRALNTSLENFEKALDEAIIVKKNVKQFFVKELLKENNKKVEDFETFKFAIIRITLERNLMKTFVEQYEDCQQELIEIDQKLADLQKQTSHN